MKILSPQKRTKKESCCRFARAAALLVLAALSLPALSVPAPAAVEGSRALLRAGDLSVSGASFARWYAIVRETTSGDALDAKVEQYLSRKRESLLLARAAADAGLAAEEEVVRQLEDYRILHLNDFYLHKAVNIPARTWARDKAREGNGFSESALYRQEKERLSAAAREKALVDFSFQVDQKALESALWTNKGDKVVARTGDREILFEELVPQLRQVSHPGLRTETDVSVANVILHSIQTRHAIAAMAEREGYGKDGEFLSDMEEEKIKVLSRSYIEGIIYPGVTVSREEIEAYYDENRETFRRGREKEMFDLNVRTLAEAEKLLLLIGEGGDFTSFVREFSRGPTRDQGGALGFLAEGEVIPVLDEAIKKLKAGETSGIIQSPHGFHILYCKSVQEGRIPPLEELAPGIRAKLTGEGREQALRDTIGSLEESLPVAVDGSLLNELRGEE